MQALTVNDPRGQPVAAGAGVPREPSVILLVADETPDSVPAVDRALQLVRTSGARMLVAPLSPTSRASLASAIDRASEHGRSATMLQIARTASGILEAARSCDADLIVVPSHCRSVPGCGSLAGRLARSADRPVLVVQSWAQGLYAAEV